MNTSIPQETFFNSISLSQELLLFCENLNANVLSSLRLPGAGLLVDCGCDRAPSSNALWYDDISIGTVSFNAQVVLVS